METATPPAAITTVRQDRILRILIDRPEKKNALNQGMYAALAEAIEEGDRDPDIRVILLQGNGDCFTSGYDLQDFMDSPPAGEGSPVFHFLTAISQAQKPLVAAVRGVAIGVGTTLLLHCDLACAGESAVFQLPFVNLGLCPEAASSLLLPKLVGYRQAAELLLLGEPFDAGRARQIGLVNAVFPDDRVLEETLAVAEKLAARPPASVRLTKALLKKAEARAVAETIAEEGRCFLERLHSPEAAEAFAAFFARRPPDFSPFS